MLNSSRLKREMSKDFKNKLISYTNATQDSILLDKFRRIDNGLGLGVGKADYIQNLGELKQSPVFTYHSLN
jgi:hypothetical protein